MKLLCALLILLFSFDCYGYGSVGHQTICQIAWLNIGNHTKTKITELLKQTDYTNLAESCTWPDDARKTKQFRHTSPHHFVNVPRSAKTVPQNACPAKGCVLSAIQEHRKTLTSNDAMSKEKATALMFLSHFIGDIHQPMHVSYADDKGGNSTYATFFNKRQRLHLIWDIFILHKIGIEDWQQAAKTLNQQITDAQRKAWINSTPLQWANESLILTREIYKRHNKNANYAQPYVDHFKAEVKQRMMMAGIRLAAELEMVFA